MDISQWHEILLQIGLQSYNISSRNSSKKEPKNYP